MKEDQDLRPHIVVVGAGIIGLTTAFYLSRTNQFRITCLDKATGPGTLASFQNGAFLDPALYTSWANHALLTRSVRSFLDGKGGAAVFKPSAFANGEAIKWGLCFLYNSLPSQTERNGENIRNLSFYSMMHLNELQKTLGKKVDMTQTAIGSFELFSSSRDFKAALNSNRMKHVNSLYPKAALSVVSPINVNAMQRHISPEAVQKGVLFSPEGTNGDVHQMSLNLVNLCTTSGVSFRYETNVSDFILDKNNVILSLLLQTGEQIKVDAVVLASGAQTPQLAKKANVHLSMLPVKGYIISGNISPGFEALKYNIYAGGDALISPLGKKVQISGGADFVGYDYTHEPKRAAWVYDHARELFSKGFLDETKLTFHTCIRPISADDVPFIGASKKIPNLYINAGHGSKGWTQSFGASALLADIIAGNPTALDMKPFSLHRFSWW